MAQEHSADSKIAWHIALAKISDALVLLRAASDLIGDPAPAEAYGFRVAMKDLEKAYLEMAAL